MRVVAIFAWPSHSWTLAMSAWWSSALVAAVARSAWAPISKPSSAEYPRASLGIKRLIDPASSVIPDWPEEGAVLVHAVAGRLEVIVDQFVCPRVQRQIPRWAEKREN